MNKQAVSSRRLISACFRSSLNRPGHSYYFLTVSENEGAVPAILSILETNAQNIENMISRSLPIYRAIEDPKNELENLEKFLQSNPEKYIKPYLKALVLLDNQDYIKKIMNEYKQIIESQVDVNEILGLYWFEKNHSFFADEYLSRALELYLDLVK